MKKLIVVGLLILMGSYAKANHIVGGELELVHLDGFNYRLNLIQYFDLAQTGNPGPEASLEAYIFRKRDNVIMDIRTLPLSNQDLVPYTNIACIIDELSTLRAVFTTDIFLSPEQYNDPEGYYIVWERCCRNFAITNIQNPGGTGMTYLLDFPPVVDENGDPFVNSSPQLFPPLSDYACINQLYYVDFAGTDVDGDSIAYSLDTPLNSSALVAVPIPTPKPHPEVIFVPGVDVENSVPGNPSLSVNTEGFLTVTPESVGLYVFSVRADEFRDGIKIGEVRRDFQLLVVDGCDPPAPPVATVKIPDQPDFDPESQILEYFVGDSVRCFEFLVTDQTFENELEFITFRAEGVNFDAELDDIFSITTGFISPFQDTLRVEVCVGECPYTPDGPYILDLIAADDACPLPQQDTVRLTINVEPPPNEDPFFSNLPSGAELILNENERGVYEILGEDVDLDNLDLQLFGIGFDPEEFGFSLVDVVDEAGRIEKRLVWNTNCREVDFGDRTEFSLGLKLEDADECALDAGVEPFLDFQVVLPPNTSPEVSTDLSSTVVTTELNGSLGFTVNATDADGDTILLQAVGADFSLSQLGAEFVPNAGIGSASSMFNWDLDCAELDIDTEREYLFYFLAEDFDTCQERNADTLEVRVNIVIPENEAPVFDSYDDLELLVNQDYELDIRAVDPDNDFMTVSLFRNVFFDDFEFIDGEGQGSATGTLRWRPNCSLLGTNLSPRDYDVSFLARDLRCPNAEADTLEITFTLREPLAGEIPFLPANAFSPNGDGINEVFTLSGLDLQERNLPPNQCENVFEYIRIFDRTGKEVYSSNERTFQWTGDGASSGTYFYLIKYTSTDYKGYVTMVY